MKPFSRWVILFGIVVSALCFSGCASTPPAEDPDEKVSTLPWNKPQQWEHSAPMGSGGATY